MRLETADGQWVERIPAWIRWATQEWNEIQYNGVFYSPPEKARAAGVVGLALGWGWERRRPVPLLLLLLRWGGV